MEGYTRKQISEILDMPERAINYYTERNMVIPEIDKGYGRGKVRRYSKQNIVEIGILKQLAGYGLSFKVVDTIFSQLRNPQSGFGHIFKAREKIKMNSYIVLYQKKPGIFHIDPRLNQSVTHILDQSQLDASGSVLIINLGQIDSLVKAL